MVSDHPPSPVGYLGTASSKSQLPHLLLPTFLAGFQKLTNRTVYFFIRNAPLQFKVTAILTVCWDCAVLAQRVIYKAEPPISARGEDEEEARGLRLGGAAPG
jgi:hypothetical protein